MPWTMRPPGRRLTRTESRDVAGIWHRRNAGIARLAALTLLSTAVLAACGGGGSAGDGGEIAAEPQAGVTPAPRPVQSPAETPAHMPTQPQTPPAAAPSTSAPAPTPAPSLDTAPSPAPATPTLSTRDAARLADQATFGATEPLIAQIKAAGASGWIASQMSASGSRYSSGGSAAVHQNISETGYCDQPGNGGENCWRDSFSHTPLVWDFYRNAVSKPDQLRQRVAFALQQIVVVSGMEIEGTYGLRNYHNNLIDLAFGNYRQVLKKVALSPVMGDYLNNVNNDKAAPNENFARELLQLFSIGTCELNLDGTLKGGDCKATYDNDKVRAYAFAMTGWTYPPGGKTPWDCWPRDTHCQFYNGDMVAVPKFHDTAARTLLSGVTLAAGHTAESAMEKVLDSLMVHPNIGPFIGRQLIQHLVSSNPSQSYVSRVAAAFNAGKYQNFGTGQRGDLAATIAAVLLDTEARSDTVRRDGGKLREPVLMFTGVLRALNGRTDGDALGWWWGDTMRQHMFRPPSVFNFYPPDYPVAGTTLIGPTFSLHNASAAVNRLNYLVYLLDWGGSNSSSSVPNAVGTKVDLSAFTNDAGDAGKLVDRLSTLAIGKPLPAASRTAVIKAVEWWTSSRDAANWKTQRVKAAAYLVFGSPDYQVQR